MRTCNMCGAPRDEIPHSEGVCLIHLAAEVRRLRAFQIEPLLATLEEKTKTLCVANDSLKARAERAEARVRETEAELFNLMQLNGWEPLEKAQARIAELEGALFEAVELLKTIRMIEDRDECSSRCGEVARSWWADPSRAALAPVAAPPAPFVAYGDDCCYSDQPCERHARPAAACDHEWMMDEQYGGHFVTRCALCGVDRLKDALARPAPPPACRHVWTTPAYEGDDTCDCGAEHRPAPPPTCNCHMSEASRHAPDCPARLNVSATPIPPDRR